MTIDTDKIEGLFFFWLECNFCVKTCIDNQSKSAR